MVYSLDVNNTRTGNGGVCVQVDIAHRGPVGVLGLLRNQGLAVLDEIRLTGLVVDVKHGALTIKEDHIYQGGVEDGLVSQGGALGLFYALLLFGDVALCAQDLYGESAFTLAQDRHGDLIDALEILELTVGLTLERGSLDEEGLRRHHALAHLRHGLQQLDKVFTVIEL